jgi:hypothetical protein
MSGDVHVNPGPVLSKSRSLSICHVNIRSLSRSKLLAIKTSLCDIYDVITLSETYLHQGISNDVFSIPDFHDIIRKDRDGHGGGVAIYIRNNVAYKRLHEFEVAGLEAIWVSINTIEGKILLCSCYRPPDKNEFWLAMDTVIDNIKQSNTYKYIFLLGDLNADLKTCNGTKLLHFCNEHNLQYLITEPTRLTATSQTILDQILTNAPNFVSNIVVSPPVSTNDHCTVSANIDFKIEKEAPYYRDIWLYKNADFDQFRTALLNADFDTLFEDDNVDNICKAWSDKFVTIAKQHIPNKTVLIRPNDSPWYNCSLRLMKRKMLRMFRKFKMTKNDHNWETYKKLRNEYQHALDKAEADYNRSLTDSLKDSKTSKGWWRTVKSLLGKGSFRSFPPMEVNNSFVTKNQDKATAFNNFFLSHSDIDTSNAQLPPHDFIDEKLVSVNITQSEVIDLLKCIDTSKATGPDGISPKLLFEAGHTIVPSLTRLFNMCLSSCKVPQMWKYANVLPLYKNGDRESISNYRPVSLLSCTSKILERIIFKNLYNYIRDNNILTPHQSGFRPGDSTTNQLAYLYHMFSQALDSKKDIKIVFCDISKAFDRVWHDALLYKLRQIGVGGNLLVFLKDYLTNRYQRVVVEGKTSELGLIKAGVPQGSVLGPLLFLIYINDLPENLVSNIKLFADDTSLYIEVDDEERAAETMNTDLQMIKTWADQWLVKFSPNKTKLMTCSFRNNCHPEIKFDNVVLTETKSNKHLGLTFSSNLSWSEHISSVLKSVSPMADVLKKLKYNLDRDSLEKIYFSFIRPKLEYGCHIWDNCYNVDANLLEDFQWNIARIVTGARKGTSHDLIKKELNWPSLADRRKGTKLKNFIKIINKDTPEYLQSLIPKKFGDVRPQSRNCDNYYPIKARTETFKNSFIPSTVQIWNSLDNCKRNLAYCNSLMQNNKPQLLYYGNRASNIKHSQLRMQCSKLNYHLFLLHVRASYECTCGYNREDVNHYLLQCPFYFQSRNILFQKINTLGVEATVDNLLYGSKDVHISTNYKIFEAVHIYIESTERL